MTPVSPTPALAVTHRVEANGRLSWSVWPMQANPFPITRRDKTTLPTISLLPLSITYLWPV